MFTEISEEERASILVAPEFLNFVEQSSKIVQRALNDNYDYTRDYRVGAQTGEYVVYGPLLYQWLMFELGTIRRGSASKKCAPSGTNDGVKIAR